MAADLLAAWWQHQVVVERYTGSAAYGDTYAAPVTITGLVDDSRKLVRTQQGDEVVSSATVYFPASTADIPLGSRVTLPATFGSLEGSVIESKRHDAGTQPTPDHLEVALQ